MRISQDSMFRTMMTDNQRLQYQQYVTSTQISTNRKVNMPSDSDYAVTILRSRLSLDEVSQYQTNLDAANTWMKSSESSMQSISTALTQAKALAEQMSTGTYQSGQQAAAASQVTSLIDQIISLANTALNGSYIFGGTRNNVPPILSLLTAADPATLASDTPAGHNTQASITTAGGNSYFTLGRQTAAAADTITIAAANTLGAALGLNFSAANFTHSQTASNNPAQTDIYTSAQALLGPTDLVSNRIGEAFSWTAAGVQQTYATQGVVTFSGNATGGQVTVGGADVYNIAGTDAATSAANLVEQINQLPAKGYYAYLEQSGSNYEVHIASQTPGVGAGYSLAATVANANMAVDGDTTLQEMNNQINSGLQAAGTLHISAAPGGANTVTVGASTWTWNQVVAGVIPPAAATPANYASALADWINAHNQDVTASVSQDGGGATVQVVAKQVGAAGNLIALASGDAGVQVSAATLLGGLAGADTTGHLMATGTSTLSLPPVVSFTGNANGAQVSVGSARFNITAIDAASSASNLTEQINADTSLPYYAWVTKTTTGYQVNVGAKSAGVNFGLSATVPSANMSVGPPSTLETMVTQYNAGLSATGALHFAGLPAAGSTITIGGATFTAVAGAPGANQYQIGATAAATAANLATAITNAGLGVAASTTANGSGATVQLTAKSAGVAGNTLALASSDANVTASASTLLGGQDGYNLTGVQDTVNTSALRLATTLRGQVTDVDAATGAVTMRLTWYDDNGAFQTADAVIPAGQDSAVSVSGLGGIQLYRDDKLYKVGAVFDLSLGHNQGNDGDLNVNFSASTRMQYNWTASQVLGDQANVNLDGATATAVRQAGSTGNLGLSGEYGGLTSRDLTFDVISGGQVPGGNVTFRVSWNDDQGEAHTKDVTVSGAGLDGSVALPVFGDTPSINLDGDVATQTSGTGTGKIHLSGDYQGTYPQNFTYTVTSGGQLPTTPVTVRATWTDDQGQAHTQDVTLKGSGQDNAVEVTGAQGVKIYLDGGTYQAGDTYSYGLKLNPAHAGEAIYFHVDNGNFVVGDSFHYSIEKNPLSVIDTLKQWQYQLQSGDQEAAQTQSQRTLESLNLAQSTIQNYIGDSGTLQNRVTVRTSVLEDHTTYDNQNLQDLQDVDLTQAFLDLRSQQTAYSSSLKVFSTMKGLFLADYLAV